MESVQAHRTPSPNKVAVPFYAPPAFMQKTSAEIISEARAAIERDTAGELRVGRMMAASIRPVNTKRPFTPRERQRTLFGTACKTSPRPPSSFSLGSLQFQDSEISSPVSTPPHYGGTTVRRLEPLPSATSSMVDLSALDSSNQLFQHTGVNDTFLSTNSVSRFRLPSINKHGTSRRHQFRASASLDNLPEEMEGDDNDSENTEPTAKEISTARKAYSSPVQRTCSLDTDMAITQIEKSEKPSWSRTSSRAQVIERRASGDAKPFQKGSSTKIISNDKPATGLKRHKEEKQHLDNLAKTDERKLLQVESVRWEQKKPKCLEKREHEVHNLQHSVAAMVILESEEKQGKEMKVPSSYNEEAVTKWDNRIPSERNIVSSAKRSYQKTPVITKLSETQEDDVQSELNELRNLATHENSESEMIKCLKRLYTALENGGAIGKNAHNTKLKAQVLKTLYKFVESSTEAVLLQIARIILAFRVNGKNLSGVCKLVFKVSRCDTNDRLFCEDNILELFMEALGSASPLEDAEACVYGYGALKFLTMNNILLSQVIRLGILELMVLHMKMVNVARLEDSRIPEQTSHALFQLTGALRNVAGEEEMFPRFVSSGAVSELCQAMELFSSDLDVVSNISRTLSIISTHDDCCLAIVDYENSLRLFVRLFQKYPGRQDIVVRLGYALGNLMARSDTARTKFYAEEGAIISLLNLLTIYLEKDEKTPAQNVNDTSQSDVGSDGSVEDVIIKIIRIVANMSINPDVGNGLAGSQSNITITPEKNAGRFLDILLTILRRKSVVESEELVHSILSTLNNLSYYPNSSDGAFAERQLEIAEVLALLLDHTEHRDCLVEVTRVFGNLTRSKDVRDFILESGAWERLLRFLEWDDMELLATTVGVLVNMMADWDKRLALKQGHGVERLTTLLGKFAENDWELATLICQALWNYCIESTDLHAALGVEETNRLLTILADCLDEERLFGVPEGSDVSEALANSESYLLWEEFAGVATNLLEKVEMFLDSLDPLEPLPEPTQSVFDM